MTVHTGSLKQKFGWRLSRSDLPPRPQPLRFVSRLTAESMTRRVPSASNEAPVYLSALQKHRRFFSGVGKVGPLMRWLQEYSSTPFELPALPHLSEADKPLFRKQLRERQELQAARAASQS